MLYYVVVFSLQKNSVLDIHRKNKKMWVYNVWVERVLILDEHKKMKESFINHLTWGDERNYPRYVSSYMNVKWWQMTDGRLGCLTNCLIMFCTLFCTVFGLYPPALPFIPLVFVLILTRKRKRKNSPWGLCSCVSNLSLNNADKKCLMFHLAFSFKKYKRVDPV